MPQVLLRGGAECRCDRLVAVSVNIVDDGFDLKSGPRATCCDDFLTVESIRRVQGTDKVESEIRYFLSSCRDDPAVLGAAIRAHWSIENAVHWVLDVTFREDDSRVRDRTAARNLALLRKIALNLIGRDRSSTASVRARRKRAAWNDDYMFQLLAGSSQSPA